MLAVGNDELLGPVGETAECPACGEHHSVVESNPAGVIQAIRCGEKVYIVGLSGRLIARPVAKKQPWTAGSDGRVMDGFGVVAELRPRMHSQVRLVAAAPELAAVLSSLLAYIEGNYDVPTHMRNRARDVLGKIKG
jgi:hypothetical protein